MTDFGYSNYKLNGTSLQNYAWAVSTLTGLDSLPGRRGANNPTPYQDGDFSFGEKFYQSRMFHANIMIFAQDAAGAVTASDGAEYHLRKNVDDFKTLCHENPGLQTLSFEVKDGIGGSVTREIDVEVLLTSEIQQDSPLIRSFLVEFSAPRPFWRETPLITVNRNGISTDSFNIDTAGNAPIGDAVITIDATAPSSTPHIECTITGDRITISDVGILTNDQFVIDLGTKTYTKNGVRADSFVQRESAPFLRLPAASSLAMTFGSVSGTFDLQLEYYKKWL